MKLTTKLGFVSLGLATLLNIYGKNLKRQNHAPPEFILENPTKLEYIQTKLKGYGGYSIIGSYVLVGLTGLAFKKSGDLVLDVRID